MSAVDLIVARIGNAREVAGGYVAPCPAHKGKDPKLTIRPGTSGVLLKCWSHGCSTEAICTAVGLELRDLFDRHDAPPPPIIRPRHPPTEAEVNETIDEHLWRIVRAQTKSLGHTPPLTSDNLNSAYRNASRDLEITLPLVPWTHREKTENRERLRENLKGCLDLFSPAGAPGRAYLESRKVAPGDILAPLFYKKNVRLHPDWLGGGLAIIFAVRDAIGELVGVNSRYLRPLGNLKSPSLGRVGMGCFSTPGALAAETIAVVESPLDAITFAGLGVPSCAIIGAANYRKPFYWPHLKASHFLICTDNDDAGDSAATDLAGIIGTDRCERFAFPANVKDANAWLLTDASGFRSSLRRTL